MEKVVNSLKKDLKYQRFTDCTFVFHEEEEEEEKKLSAHKNVLASVSSVFHAMFYGSIKEAKTVVIEDITYEVFHEMLLLIYSKNVTITTIDQAWKLYYASQKYDIKDIQEKCRIFMIKHLNSQNVGIISRIAELFCDSELIQNCREFLEPMIYNATKAPDFFKTVEKSALLEFKTIKDTIKSSTKEVIKNELDHQIRVKKLLNLIQLLISEVNQLFEVLLPSKFAQFDCSLNWIPPEEEFFDEVHRIRLSKDELLNRKCPETNYRKPHFWRCYRCERNLHHSPGHQAITRKGLEIIEKYGKRDVSRFLLEDVKSLYKEMENFMKI